MWKRWQRKKLKSGDVTKAIAAAVVGALGGVSTGAGAGVVLAPYLLESAVIAATFDPTFVTPIVLGMIGAGAGGYYQYKKALTKKGDS